MKVAIVLFAHFSVQIVKHLAKTFGLEIDKDVVRRVLASHYRPKRRARGPSWLTFLCHAKDSLVEWSRGAPGLGQ